MRFKNYRLQPITAGAYPVRGKRGGISNVDTYGSNKRIEQEMSNDEVDSCSLPAQGQASQE
jgi:hypothetical protein